MSAHTIYGIRRKDTNELLYIGVTRDVEQRWSTHTSELLSGIHHNRKLQIIFNQIGKDGLWYEVVESVADDAIAREREYHYIKSLNPVCNSVRSPKVRSESLERRPRGYTRCSKSDLLEFMGLPYDDVSLVPGGIYAIKDTLTSIVTYVGSAEFLMDRLRQHLSSIRLYARRGNVDIPAKYMASDGSSLAFQVLEIVRPLKLLREREQYWIDFYNPVGNMSNAISARHRRPIKQRAAPIEYISETVFPREEDLVWIQDAKLVLDRSDAWIYKRCNIIKKDRRYHITKNALEKLRAQSQSSTTTSA